MPDALKYDFDPNKTYKRLLFTINNPTFNDAECLWKLGQAIVTLDGKKASWAEQDPAAKYCKYLIYGCEHDDGEPGHTPHYQGFLILKTPCRIKQIMDLLGGRAHPTRVERQPQDKSERECNARCANYCRKEKFYMQFGDLIANTKSDLKPSEMRKKAIEWLADEENQYVRMKDIPAHLLMTPGFLTAWEAKRKTLLGPDRVVKVITVIGPTACGKSFAAHNLFPDHAKWIPGNNGSWYSNGDAPVLIIEEFGGQIDLQKMLTLLDHYPMQLEYKGSMSPAMFTTVVITSNVTPDHWYGSWLKQAKLVEEARMRGIDPEEAQKKWEEAKKALFDRIGFRSNIRGTGHYMEWAHMAPATDTAARYLETLQMRKEIWDWMEKCANEHEQPPPAATAAADIDDMVDVEPILTQPDDEQMQPPAKLQRMDAEPDLFDWSERVNSLFSPQ